MNIVDIITIVGLIFFVVLGMARGFGKSLRSFTKGTFGIILSIFVCVSLGGMIANIPFVGNFIIKVNHSIAAKSEFLGRLKLGIWVYYIVLFLATQLMRVLVIRVVVDIFEKDNQVMRFINKFLGAVFSPSAAFLFVLLVLAVFKLFDNLNVVTNILNKLDNSYLLIIYHHNPIVLSL